MKRTCMPLLLILLFLMMLSNPAETFQGASEGLLLWFQTVLPTLLPFLIITNLLVATNTMRYITQIVSQILSPVFQTSSSGTFAIISGFLCGYPMGAKVTADLLKSGKIEKEEASYLLSFCNNTSPMFLMNYVVLQKIGEDSLLVPSLCILLLPPFLLSFLFRFFYRKRENRTGGASPKHSVSETSVSFHFELFDEAIMNGFETITKVGGYIILFSVLLTLLKGVPIENAFWNHLLLPSLEVTNGVSMISASGLLFPIRYSMILGIVAFGGICAIAQTKCMLNGTGIPLLPYIIEKLITAIVTSLLAFCYTSSVC